MAKIDRPKRIETALTQAREALASKEPAMALDALLFAAREIGALDAEQAKAKADATTETPWAECFRLRNDVIAVARAKSA